MKRSLERLENSRVRLEVEIPAAEVAETYEKVYRRVAQRATIPGFRKGKAPRKIVEQRFGGVLVEEALSVLVNRAYQGALQEYDLEPVAEPEVTPIDFAPDRDLHFQITVDVFPEVKLGEYKGLTVTKPDTTVTPAMEEEALAQLRERHAELKPVEDRETVAKGDFLRLDYRATINGEPFPGSTGENVVVEVGKGEFLPDFEKQLVGMKIGEEQTISLTFPADYHREDLAGKEAEFRVIPREMRVKVYPELNDEFAQDVSKCATMEELRAELRQQIARELERRAEAQMKGELLEKAAAGAELELPATVVAMQIQKSKERFLNFLERQGLTFSAYLEQRGITEAAYDQELAAEAKKELAKFYVAGEIARVENLIPEEEETKTRARQIAYFRESAFRVANEKKREEIAEKYWTQAENQLVWEKVTSFLLEQARVTPAGAATAAETTGTTTQVAATENENSEKVEAR